MSEPNFALSVIAVGVTCLQAAMKQASRPTCVMLVIAVEVTCLLAAKPSQRVQCKFEVMLHMLSASVYAAKLIRSVMAGCALACRDACQTATSVSVALPTLHLLASNTPYSVTFLGVHRMSDCNHARQPWSYKSQHQTPAAALA